MEGICDSKLLQYWEDVTIEEVSTTVTDGVSSLTSHSDDWWKYMETEHTTDSEQFVETVCDIKLEADVKDDFEYEAYGEMIPGIFSSGDCCSLNAMDIEAFPCNMNNCVGSEECLGSGICDQNTSDECNYKSRESNVLVIDHTYARRECLSVGVLDAYLLNNGSSDVKSESDSHESEDPDVISMCDQCNICFYSDDEHRKHQQLHELSVAESTHQCSVCEETFQNVEMLNNHEKLSKCRDKAHCCSTCNERFKTDQLLKYHMRCEHGMSEFCCSTCQRIFSNARNLTQHMLVHSNVIFQCCSCIMQFNSAAELTDHKIEHHIHQCGHCSQNCLTMDSLVKHVEQKHGSNKQQTLTTDNVALRKLDGPNSTLNKLTEEMMKIESYACPKCDIIFPSVKSLKMHMINVANDQNVKCYQCGKIFNSRCQRHKHENIDNNVMYQCAVCDDGLPHDLLKRHKKRHSTCRFCCKSFNNSELLHHHTMIAQCTSCGAECVTACKLQTHRREESDNFHQCPICGVSMKHKHLSKHVLQHPECKAHQCPNCKKKFLWLNGLKIHRKQKCSQSGDKRTDLCVPSAFEESSNHHESIGKSGQNGQGNELSACVCEQLFPERLLKAHQDKEQNSSYSCSICSQVFLHKDLAGHKMECSLSRYRKKKSTISIPMQEDTSPSLQAKEQSPPAPRKGKKRSRPIPKIDEPSTLQRKENTPSPKVPREYYKHSTVQRKEYTPATREECPGCAYCVWNSTVNTMVKCTTCESLLPNCLHMDHMVDDQNVLYSCTICSHKYPHKDLDVHKEFHQL